MEMIDFLLVSSIVLNGIALTRNFLKGKSREQSFDENIEINSNNVVLDFMVVANDEILIVPTFPKDFEFDRKNKTLVLCALHDFKEKILKEDK